MSPAAPPAGTRSRLLNVLADVARDVAASALERCPYRDRNDRCTFSGGCRNQLRTRPKADLRCSGAPLNPAPAPKPWTPPAHPGTKITPETKPTSKTTTARHPPIPANPNPNSNSNSNSKGARP